MAKERGILAGRGIDQLYGSESNRSRQEESERDGASRTDREAGEESERASDTQTEILSDWTSALEREAFGPSIDKDEGEALLPDLEEIEEPAYAEQIPSSDDILPEWREDGAGLLAGAETRIRTTRGVGDEGENASLPPLATTPARMPGTIAPAHQVEVANNRTSERVPVADPGTPPSPMYVEMYADSHEPPAPLPPPREKPEAVDPELRELLTNVVYTPSAPVSPLDSTHAGKPDWMRTEPEEPAIETLPGQQIRPELVDFLGLRQRHDLWNETIALYQTIPDVLADDVTLPQALELLREAQRALLESPQRFEVAMHNVRQVQSIVARRQRLDKWGQTHGWLLSAYETLWLLALVTAILLSPALASWIAETVQGTLSLAPAKVAALWNTMAWGGIGSGISALYNLYRHVAVKRDFHKGFVVSYLVQPFVGWLLGGVVYTLIGGLASSERTASVSQVALSMVPYPVAWLIGFGQRAVLQIPTKLVQLATTRQTGQRARLPSDSDAASE